MRYSLLLSLVALCSTVAAGGSDYGATQHGSLDSSSSENDTPSYWDTQNGGSGSNNAYGGYTPESKTAVTVSKASKTAKTISTDCTMETEKSKDMTTNASKETMNASSHMSKDTTTKASKETAKAYSHVSKDTKVSQSEVKTTKTHSSGGNKTMAVNSKAMHTTIMMEHTTTVVKTMAVQYTHSVSKTLVMEHTTIISIILSTETAAMLYTTTNIIFSTETAAPKVNTIFSTETQATQAPLTTNIIFSTETANAITTVLPVMSFSTIKTGTTSSLAKQANATAPAAIFTGGAVQGTVGQKSGFFGAGLIGLVMLFL